MEFEAVVLELVFYVHIARSVVGRCGPAVDCQHRTWSAHTLKTLENPARTRERHVGLVLARISPLENSKRLSDGEGSGWVFQCDHTVCGRAEFCNVGMLLELQVRPKIGGERSECQFDLRESRVRYAKVHVALELERLQAAFAHEGQRYAFFDDDVHTRRIYVFRYWRLTDST